MSNDPSKTRERSLERQDPRSALPELREAMVPLAYAEKTMTALLRLHEDLSEEKERRIDLYRRLMDREQQLAELKAYVRLLEAERERGSAPAAAAAAPAPEAAPAPAATPAPSASKTQAPAGATPQQGAAPSSPQRAPAARNPARRAPLPSEPGLSTAPLLAWSPANSRTEDEG